MRRFFTVLIPLVLMVTTLAGCSSSLQPQPQTQKNTKPKEITIATEAPQSREANEPRFSASFIALQEALNTRNFTLLEPFVSDQYQVPGIPAAMSEAVLKQVVAGYEGNIESIEILDVEPAGNGQKITAQFHLPNEDKAYDFLIDDAGRFLEVGFFSAMTKTMESPRDEKITVPPVVQAPMIRAGNLFAVEARNDGRSGLFLVDSGAPSLVLNARYFESGDPLVMGSASGVNGISSGADFAPIENFQLGDFSIDDFDALMMDLSHLEEALEVEFLGLIGYRELEHFEVILDYESEAMLLLGVNEAGEPLASVQMDPPQAVLPFQMNEHIPVFSCEIDGLPLQLGLDTGAESNLISVTQLARLRPMLKDQDNDDLTGADGASREVVSGVLPEILVAGHSFKDQETVFSDISHLNAGYGLELDGLVGFAVLSRQMVGINFRKGEMVIW